MKEIEIPKKSRNSDRNQRIRSLFQRLEFIVEQYHALWPDQPEIHYSSGLVIATLRSLIAYEASRGSGMPQSAIAVEIRRSPVLVTRLMKEMEAAGFVERGHGHFDHRQRTVRITQKGRDHIAAFDDLKASIGERIFTQETAEGWAQVTKALDHVSAVLEALAETRRPPPLAAGPGPSSVPPY